MGSIGVDCLDHFQCRTPNDELRNPEVLDSNSAVRFPEGVLRTTDGVATGGEGWHRLGTVFAFGPMRNIGPALRLTDVF
jgi:hypothetical protein